jgi:CheY-like chemotaxis protein
MIRMCRWHFSGSVSCYFARESWAGGTASQIFFAAAQIDARRTDWQPPKKGPLIFRLPVKHGIRFAKPRECGSAVRGLWSEVCESDSVSSVDVVRHVCLAGTMVSNHWGLIQALRSRYAVTLLEQVDLLGQCTFLKSTHLLVLDCSRNAQTALQVLPQVTQELPDLCVVLVDGGISQKQIARAFEDGARDYFAEPFDINLLAERIDALCTNFSAR